MTITPSDSEIVKTKIAFSGNSSDGNWVYVDNPSNVGTFTVTGNALRLTWTNHTDFNFMGQFDDKDNMHGVLQNEEYWNWTATRSSTSAAIPNKPATNNQCPLLRGK